MSDEEITKIATEKYDIKSYETEEGSMIHEMIFNERISFVLTTDSLLKILEVTNENLKEIYALED